MKQVILFLIIASMISCNNKSGKTGLAACDTACQKDTIKFMNEDHELKPYLYISAADCLPDSIIWSYSGMGTNRKLGFDDIGGSKFKLDKNNISCFFNDTSFAWLLFNNCETGRGYFAKIPFDKKLNISRRGSALNNFYPKFSVAQKMVAYTDRGNIFVEDMITGKKAMMTFGEMVDMDYDAMHEVIDSVNISSSRIWAKVMVKKEWKIFEKNITLE
ncbi:MAG TPA: hypothetical protein VI548_13605 [Chitinophagaceae bacterium]|nr:hypothetical protein [Chitinophagaceae bacterium]